MIYKIKDIKDTKIEIKYIKLKDNENRRVTIMDKTIECCDIDCYSIKMS